MLMCEFLTAVRHKLPVKDMPNGNPAPGPLNSRYCRPVRRKETRARRWDLEFESTSLQR
jgi:hypothetical protein